MAPNHPRSTDDLIAQLARRVDRLQSALALGPVLPAYTSTTLPANPPTGLEVLVTDLGLRAYWNGTKWVYPPQLIGHSVLTAVGSITIPIPTAPAFSTLRVAWTGRGDTASGATYMCVQLNGDTSSSYLWQINQANNASVTGADAGATVDRIEIGTMPAATATAGYFGSGEFVIPNASGSSFKAMTSHSTSMNATNNGYSGSYGGQWLKNAAVNSVTLLPLTGNLAAGSSASIDGS